MSFKRNIIRSIVVGDEQAGKTALIQTYVNRVFPTKPVKRTYFQKLETIGDTEFLLKIWDTTSNINERSQLYLGIDVVIIVFDLTNKKCLQNLKNKWKEEIKDFCPSRSFIVVGAKRDLCEEETQNSIKDENQSLSEGASAAKDIGAFAYIECSSLNMDTVDHVFQTAIRVAYNDLCSKNQFSIFDWIPTADDVIYFAQMPKNIITNSIPLIKQTMANAREIWRNPDSFTSLKQNILYIAPCLSTYIDVTCKNKKQPNDTPNCTTFDKGSSESEDSSA